jgi:hypothetical protein
MKSFILLLLLLLPATTYSQDPNTPATPVPLKLMVEGPTKIKIGDLAIISVEKSTASSFKWLMPSGNHLIIDDGRRVVFSSGVGGEFQFIVACAMGDQCDVAIHTVTVIGGPATPSDNLGSKISGWCDRVDSKTKRDDVLVLAQSFSSVALIMEGGTLTTPGDIVAATYNSNKDALGERLEDWSPFREALATELKRLAVDSKLQTTEDHIRIWKAIAYGLRRYAETL